jgi:hypothetical protein
MYQDYDDMVEDEYLRGRIRQILQEQVKARGYGNSMHAELGPRNYYQPKEFVPVQAPPQQPVSEGEWMERAVQRQPQEQTAVGEGVVVGGKAKKPRKKRKLNAWQEFVKAHKGHGYSLKELSAMYKKQNKSGGVPVGGVPVGGARKKRRTKAKKYEDEYEDILEEVQRDYRGGYYLR